MFPAMSGLFPRFRARHGGRYSARRPCRPSDPAAGHTTPPPAAPGLSY
ncbi:hypothetical protein DESPIG_03012 [Desulfovibrio piger ATCC 29098]|uniref:Uncharacterized protein n=1 Tax=Desulfovibrio piger ATCC 29098 TaxID=411464 RepID=B6WY36_9BACT|nr:hypothetical protein DESPIG_03012 [Desulfovibrio piger ATCC 29098]